MAVGSTAVDNILWKIALGADIRRDGEYSQPNIVCANSQLSEVAKQAHVCENPGVQATVIPGYRYVFLCQRILDLPRVPRATDCAGARSGGHVATGQGLARTQMGILLHQLVDVYLASDPGGMKPLKPQIFGLHAALKLPSTQSVVNPANYVFYIMSEAFTTVLPLWNITLTLRDRSGETVSVIQHTREHWTLGAGPCRRWHVCRCCRSHSQF